MEYTLQMAEEIAKRLRDLPAVDASNRRTNKQGVIKHLAAEIAALQQRGYSLEQVAESLCGFGLEISTPTLKSYLQRVKGRRTKRGRKAAQVTMGQTPGAVGRRKSRPLAGSTPKAGSESPGPSPASTRQEFIATDRERL
jgi:hypothetical protein